MQGGYTEEFRGRKGNGKIMQLYCNLNNKRVLFIVICGCNRGVCCYVCGCFTYMCVCVLPTRHVQSPLKQEKVSDPLGL